MDDTDKKLMKMAKEDPELFYKRTIDTLLDVYNEDRIAIYSLLGLAVDYIEGREFNSIEKEKQRMMVRHMFDHYEIDSHLDLPIKVNEFIVRANQSKLHNAEPIGSVQ